MPKRIHFRELLATLKLEYPYGHSSPWVRKYTFNRSEVLGWKRGTRKELSLVRVPFGFVCFEPLDEGGFFGFEVQCDDILTASEDIMTGIKVWWPSSEEKDDHIYRLLKPGPEK